MFNSTEALLLIDHPSITVFILLECVAVRLCGCAAVRLCDCAVVQLCSCAAVWLVRLCGCAVVWQSRINAVCFSLQFVVLSETLGRIALTIKQLI